MFVAYLCVVAQCCVVLGFLITLWSTTDVEMTAMLGDPNLSNTLAVYFTSIYLIIRFTISYLHCKQLQLCLFGIY